MNAVPELRPLRIGEILDTAIAVYRRHAADLVRIVAVVVVPVQVVLVALFLAVDEEVDVVREGGTVDSDALAGALAVFGGATLLYTVAALVAVAACTQAVARAYLGEPVSWTASLANAFQRLGSLALLYVAVFAALFLPSFALALVVPFLAVLVLVVGGLCVAVGTPVATTALVVEGLSPWAAAGRAATLLRRRFWPTAGVLALTLVLLAILQGIVGAVFGILGGFAGGGAAANVLSAVGDVASSLVTTPLLAAVAVVAYVDLRVRAEGLDVELLARSIGPPETPPDATW